jgi:hypothetical protein
VRPQLSFHDYFEDADRIEAALPSQGQNRNAGKSLHVESPPLLLFLSKQLRGPICGMPVAFASNEHAGGL